MPTALSETPEPSIAYRQRVDELIAAFQSDQRQGLTSEDARARLERFGRNELAAEQPTPAWRRFLAQFQDVLVDPAAGRDRDLGRSVGVRARRGVALRGHRHLRGRLAERDDGLHPGVAGGGGGRRPSRDVGG